MPWLFFPSEFMSAPPGDGAFPLARREQWDGWFLELPEGYLAVGRHTSPDPEWGRWLRLHRVTVARYHCRFHRSGDQVTLQDMASTCGTPVNGLRTGTTPHLLRDDDDIGLGDMRLVYFDQLP